MVKLRLMRQGAKKRPFYRIIAIDSRAPTTGRPLEFLGTYDPCRSPEVVHLESERIAAWIERGAEPSPTVRSLMRRVRTGKSAERPKPKPHPRAAARAAAAETPAAPAPETPAAPAGETAATPAAESQA